MWCWRGTDEWSIGDSGDGEIGLIPDVILTGSEIFRNVMSPRFLIRIAYRTWGGGAAVGVCGVA